MARPLRISYAGALYHIISRGNEAQEIFIDKRDRQKFFQCLTEITLRYKVKIHTYCLMDNHYHLIMETPQGNIVDAMHYLNSSYTVYFNSIHKRIGHLFQGRYKSLLVEKDPYLTALSRYIHLNPVRKNLVKRPQDYAWSSYKYFTTQIDAPDFLFIDCILSIFSEDLKRVKRLYREFVENHIGEEVDVIKDNLYAGLIVGSRKFVKWVSDNFLKDKRADRELPQLQKLRKSPSIEEIDRLVKEKLKGSKVQRKITIYLVRKFTDQKLRQIAEYFGNLTDVGVSQIFRRVEKAREEEKDLDSIIKELEDVTPSTEDAKRFKLRIKG